MTQLASLSPESENPSISNPGCIRQRIEEGLNGSREKLDIITWQKQPLVNQKGKSLEIKV